MRSTIFNSLFPSRMQSIGPLPDVVAILDDVVEVAGVSFDARRNWCGRLAVSLIIQEVSVEQQELGRQQRHGGE